MQYFYEGKTVELPENISGFGIYIFLRESPSTGLYQEGAGYFVDFGAKLERKDSTIQRIDEKIIANTFNNLDDPSDNEIIKILFPER